jgi:hypothetical protein
VTVSRLCPQRVQRRRCGGVLKLRWPRALPAHEVVGLAVYQRAGDKPITMAMVHDVMTRLAAHPAVCSCGSCLWVGKADPVKDLARRRVLGRLWEIIS